MQNADGKEKEQLFEDFWRHHNPAPGTKENPVFNEYYKRVEYADQHFGYGKSAGWRTDRCNIYIVYGMPDNVQKNDSS